MSPLDEYRRKRNAARTPEPVPARAGRGRKPPGATFVIQEHHATSLHWDLRLERDGVLVSWAVPRGLPPDPEVNHLAVHTEDHPMEYAEFSGEIPKGEYGGGSMTIWDGGTYETEKWSDREVKIVLHGSDPLTRGRFVLFQTDGKNWMIHRMDSPPFSGWRALPGPLAPMLATPSRMPSAREDHEWCYELDVPGVRCLVESSGGRVRVFSQQGESLTRAVPEMRFLGEALGVTQVLLDGVLVGRSLEDVRMRLRSPDPRSAARRTSVAFLASDALHHDGVSLLTSTYAERREVLESLELDGRAWKLSPSYRGEGPAIRAAAKEQGLPGILAKRPTSTYKPGTRSKDWRTVRA
jgi:bifunctional non-homologous end joining protein LigD